MGFRKHKAGIITAILCLLILVAVVWFCLFYPERSAEPEGTLVEWVGEQPEVVA